MTNRMTDNRLWEIEAILDNALEHAPEYGRLQALLVDLVTECHRARGSELCDACLGDPSSVIGECGCKGTGLLADMLTTVREELYRALDLLTEAREVHASLWSTITEEVCYCDGYARPYARGVLDEREACANICLEVVQVAPTEPGLYAASACYDLICARGK